MRERLGAAGLGLLIAGTVAVSASFAWITLSRAPEVTGIATTLSGNGSLEIALSNEDGTLPEEYDIDEGVQARTDVVSSNLQWGNLVNLADESYGIDNLALRPAQLNTANLLSSPLWGASYGEDGRITKLDSNYAYAKYKDGDFITSNKLGVRAIATYTTAISDASQAEYVRVRDAVSDAHQAVNAAYGNSKKGVAAKFSPLGTMVSKYAQDKLDNANPGTNLAPYLTDVIPLYETVQKVMEKQKDAYVALANLQNYLHANNTGTKYEELTWEELVNNKAEYNAQDANTSSKNGVISLVGLQQFITDLGTIDDDVARLKEYQADYKSSGTAYYWSSWSKEGTCPYPLNRIVTDLIEYSTMTIDLNNDGNEKKVVELGSSDASALMNADGSERKVYVYGGVLKRLEQTAIDEGSRINGNAACTIKVSYFITITVYGKAYTKASGASDFSLNFTKSTEGKALVASDQVAEDTYGMVVDFWVRTNQETTKLTLEGATVLDESGDVLRYDGVNRIWGVTGDTKDGTLARESTTQGGGSCYVYYADTPEDQSRSLRLLEAMKVAFVSANGELLAQGEMDTKNYWAQNGRITVPLRLNSDTGTTYEYKDETNATQVGHAITTLRMDNAQRITAIIYLDGTQLTNDMVLSAAEIQGQLNLQFGSSEALNTVGDKSLVDKVRHVTAAVSKTELDYDNATSDDELKTVVTLEVDGAEPDEITARFIRAINTTQGSREAEMTFTKQSDGIWTSEYRFAAPGTYYLRYVQLDGVDYALEDPISVKVKGFDLKAVRWNEAGNAASVMTSDGTYSETVWVEFATDDQDKMPTTVEASFVRETDGNTVNISLDRGTNGVWKGTGTFTASGEYVWKYMVYRTADSVTGIYKDLGDDSKTLDLALGLYVGVTDKSGTEVEFFEPGATYSCDVAVRIYDNAGNTLDALTGARLFYSNGGSASNTINTDLTWNELDSCYDGTLPIVKPGRYQFAYVAMEGGQTLTKAKESPVYARISPDPVVYDESSQTSCNGDTLQFVPLTNDAQIDGIRILNSASASITAVVYNEKAGETRQEKYMAIDAESVQYAGESWTLALPTYEHENSTGEKEQTQEGTWSLVALRLTDCYDAESHFHDAENPIIWVGSDDASETYAENYLTNIAYETKDFSKLSTTVSCTVSIAMTPGTTELGDKSSTEFMHQFAVKDLGMSVAITDNNKNVISPNRIESVQLAVDYTAPTDNAYGYSVQSGARFHYDVGFTWDGEQRVWTADSTDIWQYVGNYTVQKLTVTVKGGKTLTYLAGASGIPAAYTITTKGPDSSNISLEDVKQTEKVFGKTGSNVTGTFLKSYSLQGTNLKVSLKPKDISGSQYAVLDDVTATLKLTYKDGKTAPNGGYTWSETSQYENIALSMTANAGSSTYRAGSTPLLAGTYGAAIEVAVGSSTTTMELSDISAYSKLPTVKAVSASMPDTEGAYYMNTNSAAKEYGEASTVLVENYVSPEGDLATVYIKVDEWTQSVGSGDNQENVSTVAYSLPEVQLEIGDAGGFAAASLIVPNAENEDCSVEYTFTPGAPEQSMEIGGVKEETDTRQNDCDGTIEVQYDIAYNAGEQMIEVVTLLDKQGVKYVTTLADPLTIRETNEVPPTLHYATAEGYNTFDSVVSFSGESMEVTLPTAAAFGTQSEVKPVYPEGSGWGDPVSTSSTNYCYVSKGDVQTNQVGNSCDGYKYYKYYDFTYHQYARIQRTYERTDTTTFYNVTSGLTGWLINGKTYAPGATVTVDGVLTATPVIGEVNRVYLREESVTMVHKTTQDVAAGTSVTTGSKTSTTSETEAAKQYTLPSGYAWFNNSDPYDSSSVNTTEKQIGQDYKKS